MIDLEKMISGTLLGRESQVKALIALRKEAREKIDKIACDLFREELSLVLSRELQEALKIEVKCNHQKITAIGEIPFLTTRILIYPDYSRYNTPNGYWNITRYPNLYEEKIPGSALQQELMIELGKIQEQAAQQKEALDDIPFDQSNGEDDQDF